MGERNEGHANEVSFASPISLGNRSAAASVRVRGGARNPSPDLADQVSLGIHKREGFRLAKQSQGTERLWTSSLCAHPPSVFFVSCSSDTGTSACAREIADALLKVRERKFGSQ
jgi:hypothetical protein